MGHNSPIRLVKIQKVVVGEAMGKNVLSFFESGNNSSMEGKVTISTKITAVSPFVLPEIPLWGIFPSDHCTCRKLFITEFL